jgi:hypothetical protein
VTTHKISLKEFRPGRWRATCECGKYRSSGYGYRGHAENAGDQHLRTKGVAVG